MGRGPKPRHPSVHALNGEPHLRRRNLQEPEKVDVPLGINQIVHTATAAIPDFVTTPRERAAFKTVIDDYLQRRVARSADLPAYGRWAVYLEMFIEVKKGERILATQFKGEGRLSTAGDPKNHDPFRSSAIGCHWGPFALVQLRRSSPDHRRGPA